MMLDDDEDKIFIFAERMNILIQKIAVPYLEISFVRPETVRMCSKLFEGSTTPNLTIGEWGLSRKNRQISSSTDL